MKLWFFIFVNSLCYCQPIIKAEKLINNNDFSGQIERIKVFPSKYIQPRTVDVWLPNNYSKDKKYDVIYMHDGQMLFDAKNTWNKQEWSVDETIENLVNENKLKNVIVIAIWNIPNIRHFDYFPRKVLEKLKIKNKKHIIEEAQKMKIDVLKITSDEYLKFIVFELKPYIDSNFSVHTQKEHTAIMGSSMGGLISMYAICEYPKIFGKAACISTHWIGFKNINNNPIPEAMFAYLECNLPNPKTHKIYFDFGTETLDAQYVPFESKVNEVLKRKKYNQDNSRNLKFEKEDHSENSWKQRLHIPLQFLFPN
jgi:predicted alpha/beta superfamily hydrolase